jgi:2-polyprenyl-3-methyl-5-hydroxy-6-metoxy-1,4-benzoquinol methylase
MLRQINARPEPFSHYTADTLWTDPHTSVQMLAMHLNDAVEMSSRSSSFIDRSVKWMVERFDIGDGTHIADFGCGPGLYTSRLAAHGADVTGIDFSERSLRYAKKQADEKGLNIRYVQRNYLEFGTLESDVDARYDLITMIMCDYCALSPEQRATIAATFFRHLNPGGAVLLDVYTLNAYHKREEAAFYERNQMHGFWSPDDYFGFVNTFKYPRHNVVLDKYTIVEMDRTREVYNWLQYLRPEDLYRELEAAGFSIEETLADVAGAPFDAKSDEIAVIARKPA